MLPYISDGLLEGSAIVEWSGGADHEVQLTALRYTMQLLRNRTGSSAGLDITLKAPAERDVHVLWPPVTCYIQLRLKPDPWLCPSVRVVSDSPHNRARNQSYPIFRRRIILRKNEWKVTSVSLASSTAPSFRSSRGTIKASSIRISAIPL